MFIHRCKLMTHGTDIEMSELGNKLSYYDENINNCPYCGKDLHLEYAMLELRSFYASIQSESPMEIVRELYNYAVDKSNSAHPMVKEDYTWLADRMFNVAAKWALCIICLSDTLIEQSLLDMEAYHATRLRCNER